MIYFHLSQKQTCCKSYKTFCHSCIVLDRLLVSAARLLLSGARRRSSPVKLFAGIVWNVVCTHSGRSSQWCRHRALNFNIPSQLLHFVRQQLDPMADNVCNLRFYDGFNLAVDLLAEALFGDWWLTANRLCSGRLPLLHRNIVRGSHVALRNRGHDCCGILLLHGLGHRHWRHWLNLLGHKAANRHRIRCWGEWCGCEGSTGSWRRVHRLQIIVWVVFVLWRNGDTHKVDDAAAITCFRREMLLLVLGGSVHCAVQMTWVFKYCVVDRAIRIKRIFLNTAKCVHHCYDASSRHGADGIEHENELWRHWQCQWTQSALFIPHAAAHYDLPMACFSSEKYSILLTSPVLFWRWPSSNSTYYGYPLSSDQLHPLWSAFCARYPAAQVGCRDCGPSAMTGTGGGSPGSLSCRI